MPYGGNWLGDEAKSDHSPISTLRRELKEELRFARQLQTEVDRKALLSESDATKWFRPLREQNINPLDEALLAYVTSVIQDSLELFGDFLISVSTEGFLAGCGKKKPPVRVLCSYHTTLLKDNVWQELAELQNNFGNISTESMSLITSLPEIVARSLRVGWGHDQVLRNCWLGFGFPEADDMKIVPGIDVRFLGHPYRSYIPYQECFDFAHTPFTSKK